jgi:carbonic anhydrase
VQDRHAATLERLAADEAVDRLCELNVLEQVRNVCLTTIVRDAWSRGQPLTVHGWIYALRDGLLRDLGFTASDSAEVAAQYDSALGSESPSASG